MSIDDEKFAIKFIAKLVLYMIFHSLAGKMWPCLTKRLYSLSNCMALCVSYFMPVQDISLKFSKISLRYSDDALICLLILLPEPVERMLLTLKVERL